MLVQAQLQRKTPLNRTFATTRITLASAVLLLCATALPLAAQPPQPGEARQPQRNQGSWFDRIGGARLFEPLPEDYRPLEPRERTELQNFIRRYAPELHHQLRRLKRRNPELFEQRLREATPRLRALKRVCERNPDLGRAILRFAENRQRLDRLRRAWRANQASGTRQRIRQAVRSLMADNLKIEIMVLSDRAGELERQREQRIEFQLQRLLDERTDLSEYPQRVRKLVEQARTAQDPDQRQQAIARLRQTVEHRLDSDIQRLRRRAEQMRRNAPDEVDKRSRRFFAQLEKRPADRPSGKSHLRNKGQPNRDKHRKGHDKKRPPRKPRP